MKKCENCRHWKDTVCTCFRVNPTGELWDAKLASPERPYFDPGLLFYCKFYEEQNLWRVRTRDLGETWNLEFGGIEYKIASPRLMDLQILCDHLNEKGVGDELC